MKEIVQDGNEVLRAIAKPVPEDWFGSRELETLIKDLSDAVDKEPEGVAIAAPQIGVSLQVFLVRLDRTKPLPAGGQATLESVQDRALEEPAPTESVGEIDVYINPEIVKTSRKRADCDEGCLSVRGVFGVTSRHERVTLKARRPDGSHVLRGASGLLAQIFEHEVDHLNGILFTDHAERLVEFTKGGASGEPKENE